MRTIVTESDKKPDAFEASGTSPPAAQSQADSLNTPLDPAAAHAERKRNRTLGLKLFDVLLYPILTNFVVFGMSVGATYLTRRGKPLADGTLPFGRFGEMFYNRGQKMVRLFEKAGLSPSHAETAKLVFWSFFDGTLVAPLVKLFEDRRERIGKWFDDRLGTTPANLSVYDEEPKQTWGSVLEGRLLTSAIVVPTALVLERAGAHKGFERAGKWLAERSIFTDRLKKFDKAELFHVGVFEAVYTSICTAGLYFISRRFARHHDAKTHRLEVIEAPRDDSAASLATHSAQLPFAGPAPDAPRTRVAQASLAPGRVGPEIGHEVTA